MKFNLRYNPHKNKTLPKIKKNQQIRSIKTKKYVQKTEIYNKNRKTIGDFAMARIGHHTGPNNTGTYPWPEKYSYITPQKNNLTLHNLANGYKDTVFYFCLYFFHCARCKKYTRIRKNKVNILSNKQVGHWSFRSPQKVGLKGRNTTMFRYIL